MSVMSVEVLTQQIQALTAAIQEREALLPEIKKRSGKYLTQSDVGWLLSIFTSEAGTLMAVTRGIQARKWDELAKQLDEELLWLRIDQKFKAKELETFVKQPPNAEANNDVGDP
jgi:hypothetical protein